jgi:activator of HSP90 ATPase
MESDKFELTIELPVSPDRLFRAWLDSDEHTAFTGSKAAFLNEEGTPFTAWDGYIEGEILELEVGKRILQTWRTTDFPYNAEYSFLELIFNPIESGCKLTLHHWNIPKGQGAEYHKGWEAYYFIPMREYFEKFGKYID